MTEEREVKIKEKKDKRKKREKVTKEERKPAKKVHVCIIQYLFI